MVKRRKEELCTTGYRLLLNYNPQLAKESGYSTGIGSDGLLMVQSEALELAGSTAKG